MQQIKIKLKFSEVQVMDYLLHTAVHQLETKNNYANKTVMALLIDFGLKRIKPLTYMHYTKPKGVSLPIPVACALVHLWQNIQLQDAYMLNVIRTIILNIEPKLIG